MDKMIRKHFSRELEKVKKQILSLGAMVEERDRMALKAVDTNDAELAQNDNEHYYGQCQLGDAAEEVQKAVV